MTYLFQTLEKTAVNPGRGIKLKQQPLAPVINKQRVPEHQPTVAGKLRECQALGPRVNLLENKLKEPPQPDKQTGRFVANRQEKVDMAKQIADKRTEELKIKQQLVDKQKKQKELTRLKFYLSEEEKKEAIIAAKDTSILKEHQKKKVEDLFRKQEVVQEYHQRQMQKMADVKAIREYQSKKIVEERQQQKEYEKLLEAELEEELKQLKQREKELQNLAKNKIYLNPDGSLNESMAMSMSMNKQQLQPAPVQKPKIVQDAPRVRSCDVLRAQMIQERMK